MSKIISPSGQKLNRLPIWVKEHIESLTRERDIALAACSRLSDAQTPSPIFVDDWCSEPRIKMYVQSPSRRITIEHAGVHLDVFLAPEDDGQRNFGIELQFSQMTRRLTGGVAILPRGIQTIELVANENIR